MPYLAFALYPAVDTLRWLLKGLASRFIALRRASSSLFVGVA